MKERARIEEDTREFGIGDVSLVLGDVEESLLVKGTIYPTL